MFTKHCKQKILIHFVLRYQFFKATSFLHNDRCEKCEVEELQIGDHGQIKAFKNFRSFVEVMAG